MPEFITPTKRSYRLREPNEATDEQRVKVGLYLLPSLYQRVKVAALTQNKSIYSLTEQALEGYLRALEGKN